MNFKAQIEKQNNYSKQKQKYSKAKSWLEKDLKSDSLDKEICDELKKYLDSYRN